MTGSQVWQKWNSVFLRAQFWLRLFSTSTSPTSRVSSSVTVINMLTIRRFTSTRNHVISILQLQAWGTTLRVATLPWILPRQTGCSTPQHSLEERKRPIAGGNTPLKRISCTKLLGVHVDQHLTWKTHVDHVLSSSYGTLSVLPAKA